MILARTVHYWLVRGLVREWLTGSLSLRSVRSNCHLTPEAWEELTARLRPVMGNDSLDDCVNKALALMYPVESDE